MDLNQLSSDIIKAAINVHKELGSGLLESVYQSCMVMELQIIGKKIQSEISFPIGLLINFNEVLLKNGITRIINAPQEPKGLV